MSVDLTSFEPAKGMLIHGYISHYVINPNLQSMAQRNNTIVTLVGRNGVEYYVEALYDPVNNQILPPVGYTFDNPPDIRNGDVGTNEFNTGVGRNSWRGFTVINVASNMRKMTVRYDDGKEETFQWRKPGHWIPVGIKAKDYRFNHIKMGQKRTEIEQGWF